MKPVFMKYLCLVFFAFALTACEPGAPVNSQFATALVVPPSALTQSGEKSAESVVDYVVVQKNARVLSLWKSGRPVKTYPILAMGDHPIGQKVYEGDERTPEGQYFIEEKHPSQNFQKFLKISYPNEKDRALAKRFGMSPGGNVGIHGDRGGMAGFWQRRKKNWTDGCLAMRNADIEEIYEMVSVGTPILIKP